MVSALRNSRFWRAYSAYYGPLLAVGLPLMIGQLGIIVVGFADNIMVGNHTSDELAAASFVNNLFNLPLLIGVGFSYGLTPLIGTLMGQNRSAKAGQMLRCGLVANGVLAMLLGGIMLALYFRIDRMGQPDFLLPLIRPYYRIQLASLLFVMLFNAFKQFSDGIMDTRLPMYVILGANLVNIVGNYLLIFGKGGFPELGLTGAGISTLAARALSLTVIAVVFLFSRKYHRFRTGFRRLRSSRADYRQIVSLGTPVAFQLGTETAAFSMSVILIGWLGAAALAAHQVVGTVTTVGFMIYYAIGSAVAILISNRRNDESPRQIVRIGNAGFHLILVVALFNVAVMLLLRREIGALFTDSPAVVSLVALLVLPMAAYQIGDGLQIAYANALRGIEDVKPLALISFFCYFGVCLPCSYLFGFVFDWGAVGVWCGFPVGLTLAGLLYFLRFRYRMGRIARSGAGKS